MIQVGTSRFDMLQQPENPQKHVKKKPVDAFACEPGEVTWPQGFYGRLLYILVIL